MANEVTNLCHGKIKTTEAFKTSQAVFNENIGSNNLPTIEISKEECPPNISIIQLLTMSGMVKSGKEARRLITDKAVKLEGKLINNISGTYEINDFVDPQKLSIGKKKHFNIIIT